MKVFFCHLVFHLWMCGWAQVADVELRLWACLWLSLLRGNLTKKKKTDHSWFFRWLVFILNPSMMMIMYETVGNFHLLGFSARQGLENSGVICSLNRKCVIVRSQVNFKSSEWRVRSRNLFYLYRFFFAWTRMKVLTEYLPGAQCRTSCLSSVEALGKCLVWDKCNDENVKRTTSWI